MSRVRHRLIGLAAAAAALLGLAVPAATAATPGATLRISNAAGTGADDNFSGDSCTSSSFCMAVGGYQLGAQTVGLSERLSGGAWVSEPVPAPPHGGNVYANEVSCASSASCLFVGDHRAGSSGPSAILAEYWNGSSWRVVAAPAPVPKHVSGLADVACPTTRFCVAVGESGTTSGYQDAAWTWTNRTTWRRSALPRPSDARWSELAGLACSDARNCMAVGDYRSKQGHTIAFAARWHGGRWHLLATPSVRGQRLTWFEGISCPTATLCVADGNTEDNTRNRYFHAFAEVWSGGKWHVSLLRRPASVLESTSCPAQNRCYAAGYTFPSAASYAHPLMETWNGRTWKVQSPVQTAAPLSGDVLFHVSCINRSDCEAAGYRFNPGSKVLATLAEKWNGHRWTLQTTVNP